MIEVGTCCISKLLSLFSIELQCREQGGQVRSKVYTHLSSFLPCSRDTLLKRVKKLLHSHTVRLFKWTTLTTERCWGFWGVVVCKLLLLSVICVSQEPPPHAEDPVHKLKEAIGKAMPEQIACFHENCIVYKRAKTSG